MELADDQEETGWKILHGDVFRYPNYKALFAAAMGCGTQLLAVLVLAFLKYMDLKCVKQSKYICNRSLGVLQCGVNSNIRLIWVLSSI